jgi:hypothetical protein
MNFEFVSWLAAGTILATSTTILISRDWRISLAALAVQYLAMFLLVTRHLPFAMGSAKLIAGWMVVAVLGMTRLGLTLEEEEDVFWSRGTWFRVILMGIVTLAAAGASLNIDASIPGMGLPVIVGGLILTGAGALHVSVTTDVLRVVMGLLTALAGFEILYAAVESSILVLGIAGAYLLTAGAVPLESGEEL